MGTMMALRAHARGGPEQLVYEQAPAPSAGPGEALIAVHAAAITFAELTWDLEWTTRDGADRTPVIPSHEMSGIVAGLGDGVAGLAAGDEVIGLVDFDRDGAAAEYVVMPAASLAAKPQSLSHVAAATLPLAALTAWQAGGPRGPATRRAGTDPGGRRRRRHVRRPARGDPRRPRHRHRPQHRRRLRTGPSARNASSAPGPGSPARPRPGSNVVINTVGGAVLDGSYGLLREGGRLVTLGAPPDQELAGRYKVHAMFFVVEPDASELARLAELAGTGRLRAVISQTFPLAHGRQAFESGGAARRPGKTVLVVR